VTTQSSHAESRHDRASEWQLVFTGQVREIQARYPNAHASLLNWARWTREIKGIYPGLEVWRGWNMGKPIEGKEIDGSHGANDEDIANRKRSEPLKEVKADPLDDGVPSLERSAIELDATLTCSDFPPIWRKTIKAAYCYKRVPVAEHQYPIEAGITNPDDFLAIYDACLAFLDVMAYNAG
jgi:hypothetical protein